MKLRPLTFVLFALLIVTTAVSRTPPQLKFSPKFSAPSSQDAVVRFGRQLGPTASWFCTATVVAQHTILTAKHCIDPENPDYVVQIYSSKQIVPATIVKTGPTDAGLDDWAILSSETLPEFDPRALPIPASGMYPPVFMESLFVIAYTGASPRQKVSQVMYAASVPFYGMLLGAVVIPGDSGAPVVNSHGELVAIVTKTFWPMLSIGVAVPVPKGLY
jgi:hypothetical protein